MQSWTPKILRCTIFGMPRAALSRAELESGREEICAVASRLFAERGYAGVTLRAIATELGCSPMTPYRYFADKAEIFAAVRAAAFARFADAQAHAIADVGDPAEQLHTLCRVYVDFALRDPAAYRVMFELDQAPAKDPSLHGPEGRAWQVMHDSVLRARRAGFVDGDPDTVAHLYWAAMHGLVSLHLAGKLQLGRTLEELVEPMYALMRGGHAEPAID